MEFVEEANGEPNPPPNTHTLQPHLIHPMASSCACSMASLLLNLLLGDILMPQGAANCFQEGSIPLMSSLLTGSKQPASRVITQDLRMDNGCICFTHLRGHHYILSPL